MGKKFWIIPALFIGYILCQKFVFSKTFSVFFKDLDFSRMSLLDPTVNLVVQVNNPTPITAEIQAIRGTLNIPVTLSYYGGTGLIKKYKDTKLSYTFKGTIVIDYITLPLNFGYPTVNG